MRKFYEETVLLAQAYVHDNELTVGKVVERTAKELGTAVELVGFVRFAVGEGVEKAESSDFADEVKAMAGH
jgi:elongation factor Ts